MSYDHDEYLMDAHLHFYQIVPEVSKKKCHQSVKLESVCQKFNLSEVQTTNLSLWILVDSCMISPESRLPGIRAVEHSVFHTFGAHPSIVMVWDEKARQEGDEEL